MELPCPACAFVAVGVTVAEVAAAMKAHVRAGHPEHLADFERGEKLADEAGE